MRAKTELLALMLLTLLLFACRETATPTPQTESVGGASAAFIPTSTPVVVPTPDVPPTPSPEPTPVSPIMRISQESIGEDGRLIFDEVALPDGGWLVVTDAEGNVLGHTAVEPGSHPDLAVEIDPFALSEPLIATLHGDAGEVGTFEYPGPDVPLDVITAEITFSVDLDLPAPMIEIADQQVGTDGMLLIDRAYLREPGWLIIHAEKDGEIGPAVGQIYLDAGLHEAITTQIQWRTATPQMYAVLHMDAEQPGGFEPLRDLPVLVDGTAVVTDFVANLPPDLLAYNQPVVNGQLIVDRALSSGPGWLVVYTDDGGQPGFIIGFEPLESGINTEIVVEVVETAVTPQLFLQIHEDTDPVGEFNFPAGDPVTLENRLRGPFFMFTNPGNYLITSDQVLGEEPVVTVPLIIADLDTWLVIYADSEGARGEVIGQAWLPAGVNRDVPVEIDPELATETLYAVLHQDAGEPGQFDFPDGADVPLQRNRVVIEAPFTLLSPE